MGDDMEIILFNLSQILLLIIASPLAIGFLRKLKSRLQNRRGASIFQPYLDLSKLFAKDALLAENASWIFRATPYIVFTATVLAGSTIPLFTLDMPFAKIADVIAMIALLALARFFLALAGMDIGTAFGGMGASREMTFSALAEPAMLMSVFVMSVGAESTNITTMVKYMLHLQEILPSIGFAFASIIMVAIAENGRIPIDNPATHLELTMIHEAMILEYSGRHLALIEWASAIKLLLFSTLIINLFCPWGIAETVEPQVIFIAFVLWSVKVTVLLSVLAIIETNLAKMKIFEVSDYLSTAFVLAFLGMLIHYILEVGA